MNLKEIDDTKSQATTTEVKVEIQLFGFYEAKQALKDSIRIMNGEEFTQLQKLEAFATAMKAELSIDVLHGGKTSDLSLWTRKYHAAIKLKNLLRQCESKAKLEAEKAQKEAYTRVMAQLFESIPDEIREEMSVGLTVDGWEFTTEY